jgi:peptidoglycan/LPS O-acetylase OafA/YrhL
MRAEDRKWVRNWSLRVCGAFYLLGVMAFMAAHPQPGSVASLTAAAGLAVVPAFVVLLLAWFGLRQLRKRRLTRDAGETRPDASDESR